MCTFAKDDAYNFSGSDYLDIPSEYDKIAPGAFAWHDTLAGVVLPPNLTEIGAEAFFGCSSLQTVVLPNITEIDVGTFQKCSSLQSICLPATLKKIGDAAFCECSSLQSIDLPEDIAEIGCGAFFGCQSLKSINLPDSLAAISERAFCGCNLDNCAAENARYRLADGLLIDKANGTLVSSAFAEITDIVVPHGVVAIASGAFEDCATLRSITLPQSVTKIGSFAFLNCVSLEHIALPDGVKIGMRAFWGCPFNDVTPPFCHAQ